MNEIKTLVEDLNKAFHEHKSKNDQRLAQLEKKGHTDPLLEEQVDRISSEIQDLVEMKEQIESLKTKLSRPAFENGSDYFDPGADERKQAVLTYIRQGESALTPHEVKLLASDSDPDGGYWVTSEMSGNVIQKIFETSPMRNIALVETISSDALEVPEDIDEAAAGWTSERAARTESTSPQIGVRRIPVHELYAMPKATQTLLDDAKVDVENWLRRKIADKISRLENTAFIIGDGVGKPRGILDYPAGTSAGQVRQINSGSASALTGDGLRALYYGLNSNFIPKARWVMARSAVEAVSKLKDSSDNYLWQPSLVEGEPQTLLGHPIELMEDMPAVAANSLSVAFGDFSQAYTIVDRMGIRVLRDPFSAKPFVLFYSTKRTGGDVTNFEGFVIQKTAA